MGEESFVSDLLFTLYCVLSWKEKLDEFEREKKVGHMYTHILYISIKVGLKNIVYIFFSCDDTIKVFVISFTVNQNKVALLFFFYFYPKFQWKKSLHDKKAK